MYTEPYYEQLGYYGNVSWVTLSEQWEQHIHYYIINVFSELAENRRVLKIDLQNLVLVLNNE